MWETEAETMLGTRTLPVCPGVGLEEGKEVEGRLLMFQVRL